MDKTDSEKNVQYGRSGHRQRMRESYLASGTEHMADHQILELYLSLVIPRHDVKETAYNLMNTFGSLEGVFNAEVADLKEVKGIGENTAILISLFKEICSRVDANKTKSIRILDSTETAEKYVTSVLNRFREEKIMVISLSSNLRVINYHLFDTGGAGFATVSPKDIVSAVLADHAAQIILAHNHPWGKADFSANDINFTLSVRDIMRTLGINLIDHIVVGDENTVSMRSHKTYKNYF